MELSKDDNIIKVIDKHSSLISSKGCESLIKFSDSSPWTEKEYNNFINVMKTEGFVEQIETQILNISSENTLFTIAGSSSILRYCSSNTYRKQDAFLYNIKVEGKDIVNDVFDSTIIFESSVKSQLIQTDDFNSKWNDTRKFYKINKRIIYTDVNTNIRYIVNITKYNGIDSDIKDVDNINLHYSLKSSGVIKSSQRYEFYIDITKASKDYILPSIIKMEQALYLSTFIISRKQQVDVIKKYYELIKDDVKILGLDNRKFTPTRPHLLTPKPVTLEKNNVFNPDEYGVISILSEYTVTEKADGERLLMYIDNKGIIYLINNTYRVINTGLVSSKELYNSLIDGEYISCNSRIDNSSNGLYASFDIYYYGGEKVTSLPLIGDKKEDKSRYNYLLKTSKYIKEGNFSINYIVKDHIYNKDILNDCDKILSGAKKYPYHIDGLIFTPAKLAVYSQFANKPVALTSNVKWDRVFKWKPPEQNTIDFLAKEGKVVTIDGIKYKEMVLYTGYDASKWENYTIEEALKQIYDKEYARIVQGKNKTYVHKKFQPTIYYIDGIEKSLIKMSSGKEIRCENGDKIEGNVIVEYRYVLDENIPVSMRWIPMRVREDKTRVYKTGELSQTANDLKVALSIWRTIHNPVTESIIRGKTPILNMDISDVDLLDTEDVYYSRNIPREALLSYNMLQFHNLGIKKMLYSNSKNKGSMVELACGEGGDMKRWIDNDYKFILGIDLVKKNIYGPMSGAYSRLLGERKKYFRVKKEEREKPIFPNMVFIAGDCGKDIKSGECSLSIGDKESYDTLKYVLNKNKTNFNKKYPYVSGQGANGFDVCTCMFSIHYFFKSEETLNTYLNNVTSLLKKDGTFTCTFMDGKRIEDAIADNGGNIVSGIKYTTADRGIPVWSIIRRYNIGEEDKYNKKINVFIESTNKYIPEYVVSYELLVEKCKEYNLELVDSQLFSECFNNIKSQIPEENEEKEHIHKIVMELDKDEVLKRFSFFNRWCIFKKTQ